MATTVRPCELGMEGQIGVETGCREALGGAPLWRGDLSEDPKAWNKLLGGVRTTRGCSCAGCTGWARPLGSGDPAPLEEEGWA